MKCCSVLFVLLLAACDSKAASSSSSSTSSASGSSAPTAQDKSIVDKVKDAVVEEPVANKFCKGADGTVQDCSIACDTTKAEDVCKLYAEKTRALCDKIGKAKCEKICEGDKNPHACEHAKTMK
jgi:hypothetical protein